MYLDPTSGVSSSPTTSRPAALWTDAPATFESEHVSFEDVWSEPRPSRPGGPPVLFSGTLTPRNVRRIVELGDGWILIMGATHDDVVAGVGRLRTASRRPAATASLMVRAPLPIALLGRRPDLYSLSNFQARFEKAGATEVSVPTGGEDLDGALPVAMAELAGRWAER